MARRSGLPSEILEALKFSISDTTGQFPEELTEMNSWLVTNPHAWRLSRADLIGETRRGTGGALLVMGEAGCGKTTLLAEEADIFRSSADHLAVHVNFLQADRISRQTREENLLGRLGTFITSNIEQAIALHDGSFDRGIIRDYYAARIRWIVLREGGAFLNSAKLGFASRLDRMSTEEILDEPVLAKALQDFQEQRPEYLLGYQAVQRLRSVKRIVLLLDNLDNIGGRNAATCLELLLRQRMASTLVYCAIRDENEYVAAQLNAYMSDRVNLKTPSLSKIIQTRLIGVRGFYRTNKRPVPRSLAKVRDEATTAMSGLEADGNGMRILMKWHNGNIRHAITFVTVHRTNLARVQKGSGIHGALLGALIWNVDEYSDLLLSMLNPNDNSSRGIPFLFLKLRILAYLRKHGVVQKKHLIDAIASFGVDRGEVLGALGRLSDPSVVIGAFLRVATDRNGNDRVALLPPGDLFLSEIAYSIEFLGYQYEKTGGKQAFDPIGRLRAATVFVRHQLLPAFRSEHPYLRTNYQPRLADQRRLEKYRDLFGYGRDQWFISGLSRSLIGYAEVNDMLAPDKWAPADGLPTAGQAAIRELHGCIGEISQMEEALNELLKTPFADA